MRTTSILISFVLVFILLICGMKELKKEKGFIKKKTLTNRAKIYHGAFFFYSLNQNFFSKCKERLENNIPKIFSGVDISLLERCNINYKKPVFKILIKELTRKEKSDLLALKKLRDENEFTLIIFLANSNIKKKLENFLLNINLKSYKIFSLSDISKKLVFEINKLNVNYKNEKEDKIFEGIFVDEKRIENYKPKNLFLEAKNFFEEFEVKSSKIIFPNNDENILSFTTLNKFYDAEIKFKSAKKHEIKFCFLLEDDVLFAKKENEKIEVCFLSLKKQFFKISGKNFDFCIKKQEKMCFLIVFFKFFAKQSQIYSFSCISFCDYFLNITGSLKQIKLNLFCLLEKFFNVEFLDCSFANKLNLLAKQSFICSVLGGKDFNKKCLSFDAFVNLPKKDLGEFYLSFLKDILGLKLKNGIFVVKNLLDLNVKFSIKIFYAGKIFIIRKAKDFCKLIKIDSIEYVNLNEIDLKKVNNKNDIYCC